MKYVYLMIVITAAVGSAFAVVLNWSLGIDYSPVHASMMPIAIAWLLGVLTVASLGGILGSVLDYWDEQKA